MIWRISISKGASRQLGKLREYERTRILEEIDALASDPYPVYGPETGGKLRGARTAYKLIVDGFRVLYRVSKNKVKIIRIELRGPHTYRRPNP